MATSTVDPTSLVSLLATTVASSIPLATATAFLWRHGDKTLLVSNWHVLSGRAPATGQPLDKQGGGIPEVIRVGHHHEHNLGVWTDRDHKLYDDEGNALWRMHPRGQDVDIAILEIKQPTGTRAFFVNDIKQQERMPLLVTSEIFVVGFPFGIKTAGALPIWKRASIASEPEVDIRGLPFFFADTATRGGMSGSPVVMQAFGQFVDANGTVNLTAQMNTRFVGVYSGRIGAEDELRAQLGMVWRKEALLEVIDGGVRGDYALRSS
jgi:Trypsin-like peptidase domain